jgi:hypothetical protein
MDNCCHCLASVVGRVTRNVLRKRPKLPKFEPILGKYFPLPREIYFSKYYRFDKKYLKSSIIVISLGQFFTQIGEILYNLAAMFGGHF